MPLPNVPPSTLHAHGCAALSTFLAATVKRGDVPGVVLVVVSPDRVLYHEAFGNMETARDVPMRKDAIFRIASMTKALTSTAVMMLVEEGRLRLDDAVSRYLPAFKSLEVISRIDLEAGVYETRPAAWPMTIRQLLTHTSGIGYSWSDPGLALVEKLTGKTSPADLPLLHDPGVQWTYGASTRVLGSVVEELSGQGIAEFLESRIFGPLGMRDTGFRVDEAKRERVVTQHQRTRDGLVEIPNPADLGVLPRGDGGLFSTAEDYARFVQLMLGEGEVGAARLLKPETVRDMGRNHTGAIKVRVQPAARGDYTRPFPVGAGEDVWGLGFQIAAPINPSPFGRRPGSMGWAGINNTFFWIEPCAKIGVVLMMQVLPFYDAAALGVVAGVESHLHEQPSPLPSGTQLLAT
ncbi:MAG: serine hydrolase domain-containing protein [Bacteroidales bacterium]